MNSVNLSMDELTEFIQSSCDPRELKRALAVQMVQQDYRYAQIQALLQVSVGFISKWKQIFEMQGVNGLHLRYQGSTGYLELAQRQAVIDWLKQKNYWNLVELQQHIEVSYGIVFASKQSYYDLFEAAGISWKKTQKRNPKRDPALVEKKQEITTWLAAQRSEILTGKLIVLFEDECHLLWGDVCGYVWGAKHERVEVPIVNERSKQTYYGAINLLGHECLVQAYKKGNSEATIAFLEYLQAQYPERRIALIWDGASYHRSDEVKAYLTALNQDLEQSEWKVTCIRFAPNAPEQNPIEDVWLQAKRFVREHYHLCKSFAAVKRLFELVTHHQVFDFAKLLRYGGFHN